MIPKLNRNKFNKKKKQQKSQRKKGIKRRTPSIAGVNINPKIYLENYA